MYVVYNASQGADVFFRACGRVELWDPWTGATRPLAVRSQDANGTGLNLPLGKKEIQLIVFGPGPTSPAGDTVAASPETIPIHYPGSTASGLMGPVRIEASRLFRES